MPFFVSLLHAMGAPANNRTIGAMQYWAASEGMNPAYNNPLATTEPGYGGYTVNNVGVRAYPTEADGVAATWATLQNGYYNGVVAAFRRDAPWAQIWQAINQTPWCGGCQNGRYPVALYDALGGNPAPIGELHPAQFGGTNISPPTGDYSATVHKGADGFMAVAGRLAAAATAIRRI
jgi:hypothetical protein